MRLSDGKRVFQDALDGTPDIDDLVAGLEQLVRLLWEVVGDAGVCGGVGLVDMDAVDRAAEGCYWWCWLVRRGAQVLLGAADGVVEDKDAGGASSEGC